jgi:hypothetical protein
LREIFIAAAVLIRGGGHCKGVTEDSTGRHCTLGALIAAIRPGSNCLITEDQELLYSDALALLHRHLAGGGIAIWNDAPERTGEDVAKLFDELAEVAA